ncbi:hypothetical protein ACO2Q2_17460, partial [Dyella sp. KRB-257]
DDFLRTLRNPTAQRVVHIANSGANQALDGGRRAMLGARHGIRELLAVTDDQPWDRCLRELAAMDRKRYM